MPAEVLELPQKGDRIIHFAWEPHVRACFALDLLDLTKCCGAADAHA